MYSAIHLPLPQPATLGSSIKLLFCTELKQDSWVMYEKLSLKIEPGQRVGEQGRLCAAHKVRC